jgi:hypothetical protein
MSDAIAILQPDVFPESTMTLEEVVTAIKDGETRFVRLYQRFHDLNGTIQQEDKRKKCNPLRDLKISANRAYQWARRAGCNAEEALDRATAATFAAAEARYPSLITSSEKDGVTVQTLPLSVMAYIQKGYNEYHKKPRKKSNAPLVVPSKMVEASVDQQ